jgi:sodium/pantothenate symporter
VDVKSTAPLVVLALVMGASMWIGVAANRASEKGGFLKGYFLGNRGLGSWSMALTATVMSGGTFMGFPSLVYQYGWVVALWIASYMVVPLCTFAVLGKRMGRISRQTGAITLPDLLRERFSSPALGYTASLVIIFILAFSLIAQFKAGAVIMQLVLPSVPGIPRAGDVFGQSPAFMAGLVIFTLVVVAYTVYGGFLAAVWTDVFQSVLMAIGVLILFPLALNAAGGLENATRVGVEAAGPGYALAPGAGRDFLPLGLAFSFFCMWSIAGMGQPATLVRLMAFRDTRTLRHATLLLAVYNTLIYIPIILIFVCGRAVLGHLDKPDEAMPRMALTVANPWIAGLILAAPFGAVMATISGYLVQISSALTQDVFHRWINPRASERTLRSVSQAGIIGVALIAATGAVNSPKFLQAIVVFAGGAGACAFLVPALMAAYWPRATGRGALASMLFGVLTVVGLYGAGLALKIADPSYDPGIGEKSGNFYPVFLLGVAPFVWGLLASVVAGVGVSLADAPPRSETVAPYFTDSAPTGA